MGIMEGLGIIGSVLGGFGVYFYFNEYRLMQNYLYAINKQHDYKSWKKKELEKSGKK